MGCDCCGEQVLPPKPVAVPVAAPTADTNSCQGSGCDGNNADTLENKARGQGERSQEKPEDCCLSSGKCVDDETEQGIDVSDCCHGKIGPCCNASCIDRLAVRECERSAETTPGPYVQANKCSAPTNGKACNQHSLSAFKRYGATLQTLGCICRTLIPRGQKTCCEIRERRSPDQKQFSKESLACSLRRTSQGSCLSSGSTTKDQAAQDCCRYGNCFGESVGFVRKASTGACAGSCYSTDRSATQSPVKSKCPKPCCPGRNLVKDTSQQSKCADSCCSKAPIVITKPEVKPEVKPFGSCCVDDKAIKETLAKDKHSGSSSSEDKLATAPYMKDYFAEYCCESAKTDISKKTHNSASSGFHYKPSEQDIGRTPKTNCTDCCCIENQPFSPQSSCGDAYSFSLAPDPGLEIDKTATQRITDLENQGSGKEHAVLSISGMTCTGCETQLNRTLAAIPGVKDLRTSPVLSRAEFSIDLCLGSVEEVMKHLERTTEFKCERFQNQGTSLDLIAPDDPSKYINQPWPDGVIDIAFVNKQTMRVTFDPEIAGARDLTEKIWGPPIQLAPPHGDQSLETGSKHVRHVMYMMLLSVVLTIPVLIMAWAPLPDKVSYSSASLALATIIQAIIAGPFYPKALKALVFSRIIEMDLLIVLSTSAAYIFSVISFGYRIAGKPLSTGQFFETSTLLVTLIMVGRWVTSLARQRAVESISIRSLQASTAILVDKESNTEREIDTRLLQYGDTFKVLPDTRIPTDGTVITGSSEVDESMFTGESRPVEKHPKSVVIAGSINGHGAMTVRLNRLPSDNTICAVSAMVDEAKLSKPKLQDLVDQVASYFVPVVVTLTIITFAIWIAVGITIRGYDGSEATIQAITYAITVLIVSCPCAIGLAVPMVTVIASGVAAEKGIIFKSANAIEVGHKTSHVVFDKTGTLTQGKLSVVAKDCVDEDKLPLLLGLIENSRHPVSVAVAANLKDAGIMASTVPEPKILTGKGAETTLGGQSLRAGNSRWLNLSGHRLVQPMLAQGYTVVCFTIDNVLKAVFGLEDVLRPDAAKTIKTLQRHGVSVHVVSGDDDGAVQTLASNLSIPADNMRSRSSPTDKKDYVLKLLDTVTNCKKPIIVFCGDGTNDAVAIAQATIGVHMNEGTDVAQSAADVVLVRPSLGGILAMMNVSRKSVNCIMFNFIWSFVYNTFAVLFAAGAFVNVRIPPEFAGLGELVSVLPVIVAASLLRWSRIQASSIALHE